MTAIGIVWLVAFGLLFYVGWPLLADDDADDEFCPHCGCSFAGLCDDCFRELGHGD